MNTPFNSMIGQEDMKRKLMFYLDGYKKTSMIPNFLFVAERGCGKTMAAIEIAKNLIVETGKPKRAKEINCSTLKSVSQFAEQVLLPFVQDNDCTILFDEASELPRDLTMSLLTMLNPNSNNRNTFNFDDMTFGEMVDCDTEDILQQICILYRPITNKKGNNYTIEKYKGDIEVYEELKNTLTLDIYLGFVGFFLKISQSLLKNSLSYTLNQVATPAEKKKLLEEYGV